MTSEARKNRDFIKIEMRSFICNEKGEGSIRDALSAEINLKNNGLSKKLFPH